MSARMSCLHCGEVTPCMWIEQFVAWLVTHNLCRTRCKGCQLCPTTGARS